jgi:hypothetical protein
MVQNYGESIIKSIEEMHGKHIKNLEEMHKWEYNNLEEM